MWTFEFEEEKPNRLLTTHFTGICVEHVELWWAYKQKKWVYEIPTQGGSSSHFPCKSFKAFKRHLKNHPELRGKTVILCNRYVGCDIIATWKEK